MKGDSVLHVPVTQCSDSYPVTLKGDSIAQTRTVTPGGHPIMIKGDTVAPTKRRTPR